MMWFCCEETKKLIDEDYCHDRTACMLLYYVQGVKLIVKLFIARDAINSCTIDKLLMNHIK